MPEPEPWFEGVMEKRKSVMLVLSLLLCDTGLPPDEDDNGEGHLWRLVPADFQTFTFW